MSHDRDLRAALERIAAEAGMNPRELLAEAQRTAEVLEPQPAKAAHGRMHVPVHRRR